jgi:hypothetical protein
MASDEPLSGGGQFCVSFYSKKGFLTLTPPPLNRSERPLGFHLGRLREWFLVAEETLGRGWGGDGGGWGGDVPLYHFILGVFLHFYLYNSIARGEQSSEGDVCTVQYRTVQYSSARVSCVPMAAEIFPEQIYVCVCVVDREP